MNILLRISIGLVMVFLISCSSYKNHIVYEKELKTCKMQCSAVLAQCNQICVNNCTNCTRIANENALQRFNVYKNKQIVEGKKLVLELNSFKDPLQCRKITCSCKDDFQVCVQSCQGRIHKNLKVVAAC